MTWQTKADAPSPLAGGNRSRLSGLPEWLTAIEALMLVAERDGPTILARIGVMRALNRGHVREFNTSRKDPHWGRRKLKRDL